MIFDTSVVDLSGLVSDPVETLMKVQLGGGTDIDKALRYGEQLVENPRRSVVLLISDLFEGGSSAGVVRTVKGLLAQGSRVVVLTALDENADAQYDRDLARELANAGAHVGAMTPGELVGFLKDVIR